MIQGAFKHFPPLLKLAILILIILTGTMLASLISYLIAQPLFDVNIYSTEEVYRNVTFIRVLQIIQSLLVFILPAALSIYLLYPSSKDIIPGKGHFTILLFIIAGLIIFISQGFISWTAWLNHQLQLPDSLQSLTNWITTKEDEAIAITKVILQTNDWPQTLITVFVIAVLPAIGEEWIFRGIIQRELTLTFHNVHVAIFVTAVIFSAIHVQFLTFLPRFVLGLILGYLLLYSKNIWMPISAHFFNNFIAIIIHRHYTINHMEDQALDTPIENPFSLWVISSVIFMIVLILLTRLLAKNKTYNS